MMCHGFAGTKVGRHRIYVSLAERLAQSGIASLRLDFRGCGDSEGSFEETDLESQISDALLGLNYLATHKKVDADRIGLLGRSMGGPVAVVAARRFARVKSLALWCPVFSAAPWLHIWEKAIANAARDSSSTVILHGQPASADLFKQLFAVNIEEELSHLTTIPVLHIHSEKDEIVGIGHAEEYVRCRQQATGLSQFARLKDSDHEFSFPVERVHTIEETTTWFQKTL